MTLGRAELPDADPGGPARDSSPSDEALDLLAEGRECGGLVKLHYFAGLTLEDAADFSASRPEGLSPLGVRPRPGCSGVGRRWARVANGGRIITWQPLIDAEAHGKGNNPSRSHAMSRPPPM